MPLRDQPALVEARDLWLTVPARPVAVNSRQRWWRRRQALDAEAVASLDIVRGMSLAVAAGESVGIVGPSGSGKTSLLMLLAGLERPTRGQVLVDGIDLASLDEDQRARFRGRRIGIVFQSFHLIPTMTALENVAVPLELAGSADAFSTAEAALRQVGLGHRLGHLPGQLSGGEQQRVALARAFAPRPALLLADEPTGNLDVRTGETVQELLFEMQRQQGTALLLITHDPLLASRCDRRLAVSDGRLLAPDLPHDMVQDRAVS
ncbi:ABC transporter ATP-binding protein [Lichenicola sp.]|uniref:ABC transporter ATP-binding protein n=1 Tax=Lichenicola sp. TaxID=2804529 RepID=UPI003B002BD8